MANGGGARPESERGRGFRWPEVGGPGAGSGGERCGTREGDRRGVGDGGADGVSGVV
jgi:hypothetical protein